MAGGGFHVTETHLRAASETAWAALAVWQERPWDAGAQRTCELAIWLYELLAPGARNPPAADFLDGELELLVQSWAFLNDDVPDRVP